MKKLLYLNGLRGLAALIVVIHHYANAFFPYTYTGDPKVIHYPFEKIFYFTPLRLLISGNFAVCVFFVLSGFVLSYGYFKTKDHQVLVSGALKRYFRLTIPIFFSVFFSYILLSAGVVANKQLAEITLSEWLYRQWSLTPSFHYMFSNATFGAIFLADNAFNSVLWTMQIEFYGSLFLFAFLALFGQFRNRHILYIILTIIFFESYYLAFIWGILLCDIFVHQEELLSRNKILRWIVPSLFMIGLFFGGFSIFVHFSPGVYVNQNRLLRGDESAIIVNISGAVMVLFALLFSPQLKKFFSSKVLQFLGDISFGVYLLHLLVLGSLSLYLFKFFNIQLHVPYFSSFIFMFGISLSVIFVLSYFFARYIDALAIKASQKIAEVLLKEPNG